MTTRPFLILLATLLLATTMIGPAVADTAKEVPKSKAAMLIDRLRADASGAKLEAAFIRLHSDLWQGAGLYLAWTGQPPSTLDELESAGVLCFTARSAAGTAMPIVAQGEGAEPIADHLYVRLREKEGQLLVLGADGDPLSPLISSSNWHPGLPVEAVPALDWQDAMLKQLWHSLRDQLSMYNQVYGSLPQDWNAMQTLIPLAPHNHRVLPASATPDVGLQIAVDPTFRTIRVSRFPDLGYGTVRYFRADSKGELKRDLASELATYDYRDLYVAELLPMVEPVLGDRPPPKDETRRNPLRVELIAQDLRDAVRIWPGLNDAPESQVPLALTFLPRRDDGMPYSVSVATGEGVVQMPEAECVHLSAGPGGAWIGMVNEQLNGASYGVIAPKSAWPYSLSFPAYMLLDETAAGTIPPGPYAADITDWRVLAHLDTDPTSASARQRITAMRCATLIHLAGIAQGRTPADWDALLAAERLIPMSFTALPLNGTLPTNSRNFEVARLEAAPILRVTFNVPEVGQGSAYVTSMGTPGTEEFMWWPFFPEDYPHLITQPWIPVVRGELLPIPDPPVIPEVPAP